MGRSNLPTLFLRVRNGLIPHPFSGVGNELVQRQWGTLDESKTAGTGRKRAWSRPVLVSEGGIQGRTLGVEDRRNAGEDWECVRVCARAVSRLNRCSLSLQARLLEVPAQTAFRSGPIPASASLQVRTVPGDLWGSGRHDGSSLLHVLPGLNAGDLARMEESIRGWAVPLPAHG